LALAVFLTGGFLIFQFWGSKKDFPKYRLIKAEKLTTSGKITNLALTPNGEYAVYSQKEGSGESLWLKHLKTGGQQQILSPQEAKFVGLTISPDGDFIYFSRFGNEAETFLERVSILGGVPEKVSEIDSAVSVSFSPNGKQVAYTESHTAAGKTSVCVSNLDGSNKKTLISAENKKRIIATYEANPVAWSPKGDVIAGAFEEKSEKGASEMAIILVDPEDGSEKSISEKRWHHAMELTWIDDDNLAFYGYEKKGDPGNIWIVSRSTGKSYQLTNDSNFYQRLAGKNGKLIAISGNEVSRIKVAAFQDESDKLETKELHNESGHIGSVVWENADSVLFTSTTGTTKEIWKLKTVGQLPPTQLTVKSNISSTMNVSPADGRIVFSAEKDGFSEIWLADKDGKNLTQLTFENKDSYPDFTPDGNSVIFQRGGAFSNQTLWKIGTDGNNLKQISKNYTAFPQVSPDGEKTAYYFMDESDQHWKIGIIDNQTGKKLDEIEFPKIVNHRRMRWHPDNKVLAQVFYEGEDANLLLLPINKEKYKIIPDLGKGEIISMDWSADGQRLLFSQVNEIRDIVDFNFAPE
jgi:Tol biopolymer transport system component